MADLSTCATPEEIIQILRVSVPGDDLKITYQNQDGVVHAFIENYRCNEWAQRVLKVIRGRHESEQATAGT